MKPAITWKVCGMRDSHNIKEVLALKPDYMGFIFYEGSPRYVLPQLDENMMQQVPQATSKVGVFVNATYEEISQKVEQYALDAVQLHGDETVAQVERIKSLGVEVIKVFGIGDESFEFTHLAPYLPHVDYFLFDTKGQARGGNGKVFDWEKLRAYPFEKPFFISGGITTNQLERLSLFADLPLHGIDVNSKFELAPAMKDIPALKALKKQLEMFSSENTKP